MPSAGNDALALLAEWYDWWIETPGAPEKMPNALHVRTALLLTQPPAKNERHPCPTDGCPGDARYAAPGRLHREGCTYPIPPEETLPSLGSGPGDG